jgi:hypothetical protein
VLFLLPNNLSAPQNLIFAGLIGSLVFGFLTFVEYSGPDFHPVAESEVTYFRGRAEHAMVDPMGYGAVNYCIWLEEQAIAFRQLRVSREKQIDPAEFRAIQPGAEIVVGVETAKVDKPGKDRRLEQQFLSFVSLEADRKVVASLADFNARRAERSKKGFFFPVAFAFSAGVLGLGFAAGRASGKEEDHERSIRELVLRHQAEMAGSDAGSEPEPRSRDTEPGI